MKVTVNITKSFKIAAKLLIKKYQSLSKDLLNLEKTLGSTPRLGTPLGKEAFKIRLKVTSKGKGKSGGADVDNISDKELKDLIQNFKID